MIIYYIIPIIFLVYKIGIIQHNWSLLFAYLFFLLSLEANIYLSGKGGDEHFFSIRYAILKLKDIILGVPRCFKKFYETIINITFSDLKDFIGELTQIILILICIGLFIMAFLSILGQIFE